MVVMETLTMFIGAVGLNFSLGLVGPLLLMGLACRSLTHMAPVAGIGILLLTAA